MKSKKKRLVVAVSMLLISAALLGTASFAWFGMNTSVKATGVEVEAYSDSQYLQITDSYTDSTTNEFATDNTLVNFSAGQKDLRLVTHGVISAAKTEVFKLTFNPASGNYADESANYYRLADSDVTDPETPADTYAKNAIRVNGELKLADLVKDLYTDVAFDLVTGGTYAAGEVYYEKVGNDYVEKTLSAGDSTHGLYAMHYTYTPASGTAVDGTVYYEKVDEKYTEKTGLTAGTSPVDTYYTRSGNTQVTSNTQRYDGIAVYYAYDSSTKTYTKADNLALGTSLTGLYTVTEHAVTTESTFDGSNYYYIKNATNKDYSCIGKPESTVEIAGYLYWGRAYSTSVSATQENNTLNIVNAADGAANYYYTNTVYLRQADGTNHASGLKINKVTVSGNSTTNQLSDALRVLFVAESLVTNEKKMITYENATQTMTDNGAIFATILGDEAEVVKVDMYIYYDGTASVSNNTAATLSGQTVEVEFGINEYDYNK